MESRQAAVFRLFMIMIFFCISIFFLNTNKKGAVTATHIDICNIKSDMAMNVSVDHVYHEMHALFVAHDVDLIIKTLSRFKYNIMRNLIEKMVSDDAIKLSPEEKTRVIYGMIAYYACPKKNAQYELFDLFIDYPSLNSQTPILLTLARSKYSDLIALFIAWGKDRQKTEGRQGLLAQYAEQAFKMAVYQNDYVAVETLFTKKVRIASACATRLLCQVVENSCNPKIIPLLVSHAQADVNCVENGKTLLVAAVEKNNIEMVRMLLDRGAVVDRVVDGEKNTALTIAMRHNYDVVEQLLREYGA